MPCMSRLIKRAAVVGRLYYHTAQCLLAQINPVSGRDTADMRTAQLHHAHQVCGIVTHTSDRGVASVSIRCIAIVAEVLSDPREQAEVVATLERMDRETGWKLARILANLKRAWGWERFGLGLGMGGGMGTASASGGTASNTTATGLAALCLPPRAGSTGSGSGSVHSIGGSSNSGSTLGHALGTIAGPKHTEPLPSGAPPTTVAAMAITRQTTTPPNQTHPLPPTMQHHYHQHHQHQQHHHHNPHPQPLMPVPERSPQRRPGPPIAAPRPMRVNPLSFADFSLPNHPYQNWYEPPSRSSSYNPQGFP